MSYSESNERRNIVLVTVDSLRADRCGFMGYSEETTPTLNKMADDGVVFENAIAPGPRTPDSVPAMLTGQRPLVDSATIGSERSLICRHIQTHDTIPEWFSRHGYKTAAFTPNPYTSRYFGYGDQFDYFEDFMDEDRSRFLFERILEGGSLPSVALRLLLSGIQRENVFKPWESYYPDIVEWTNNQSRPYFLWIFLMDCHIPYLAGQESRTQSHWKEYYANLQWYWQDKDEQFSPKLHRQLTTAYDDSIRYVDAFFQQLTSDLDDAVVVATADHGEAFFEHGSYGHDSEGLYEENIRVPLIAYNANDADSRTVSGPVGLTELPELVVNAAVDSPEMESRSRVQSHPIDGSPVSVRGNGWKYIVRVGDESLEKLKEEFYNLTEDSEERRNIIRDEDSRIDEGREKIVRVLNHSAECRQLRDIISSCRIEET